MPYPFIHNDLDSIRLRDLHKITTGGVEAFNKAEDERIEAFIKQHPELAETATLLEAADVARDRPVVCVIEEVVG